MSDGITIKVLGDFGPFSRMGKSIGYELEIGRSRYLIDCGAPLFQQIGGHGLQDISGLIVTHCHDDHKRWFSDLALFTLYAPDYQGKMPLITSVDVHAELQSSSGPSLDRSLSADAGSVIDISYDEYVRPVTIGPRPKFMITRRAGSAGTTYLEVTDAAGNEVPPDRAKIVISDKTGRPRLLFRDPESDAWVEPESFYPFSSSVFYEEEQNIFGDGEGFTIRAIKSPVWHGVTTIGLRIETSGETLIFSSDTNHDPALWERLAHDRHAQRHSLTHKEFESARVLVGDINDYIERMWSEERYREAMRAFDDAVVIHDVSYRNSVVHTEYSELRNLALNKEKVLLTHSPDRITSEWMLCDSGKSFRIRGNEVFEIVDGGLCSMDADIYHKENGRYYVGYRNEKGKYTVYEKDGYLSLNTGKLYNGHVPLYRVDVYEDIAGKYFPFLEDEQSMYFLRKDGRVELIRFGSEGSSGRIVEDHRKRIRRNLMRS